MPKTLSRKKAAKLASKALKPTAKQKRDAQLGALKFASKIEQDEFLKKKRGSVKDRLVKFISKKFKKKDRRKFKF